MINRRQTLILLTAALAPRGRADAAPRIPGLTFERGLMGTRFAITCHHTDEAAARIAAKAAFDAAEEINQAASDYIADSELLQLSQHPAGTPVPVTPLLFHLILEARDIAEKTHGCFDPSLGPLTKLWRESRRRNQLPDAATLANARAASGWKNLLLDPAQRTVTFAVPDMRLDLGGIAKGQAADAMLAVMQKHGIPSSSITAGGDVRLGTAPPDATGWKIGVRTFDRERDSSALLLSNCAVSTSGDLQQSIEINRVRYAHIIDPATGLGLTHHVAATVIAPTATLSDSLATACCTAPADQAKSIALSIGATEVYLA